MGNFWCDDWVDCSRWRQFIPAWRRGSYYMLNGRDSTSSVCFPLRVCPVLTLIDELSLYDIICPCTRTWKNPQTGIHFTRRRLCGEWLKITYWNLPLSSNASNLKLSNSSGRSNLQTALHPPAWTRMPFFLGRGTNYIIPNGRRTSSKSENPRSGSFHALAARRRRMSSRNLKRKDFVETSARWCNSIEPGNSHCICGRSINSSWKVASQGLNLMVVTENYGEVVMLLTDSAFSMAGIVSGRLLIRQDS